jgi:predicted protein tyrosine phosphatase
MTTKAAIRWDNVDAYEKLHDGLSDMIEGGRLTEADIPDDYQWLVETLVNCNARGTGK